MSQNGKNVFKNKKLLPVVMSTSMLSAAFFAAGAPASAHEQGSQLSEVKEMSHGNVVSEAARTIPGSPEKGKIMRSIASKNWQDKDSKVGENPSDESGEDEGSAEEPSDEAEQGNESDEDEGSAEEPSDESEQENESGEDEGSTEEPSDEAEQENGSGNDEGSENAPVDEGTPSDEIDEVEVPADEDVETPIVEEPVDGSEEIKKPADENINEDTSPADEPDSTIVTDKHETVYNIIFERFDSLLDYYDRFIQETLGISLPVEDGNNETIESTDESTESEETEDLSVDAGDEDSTDVPAEDDDGEDSSEAGGFDEPSAKGEKTETSLEDGNDSSDTTEETVEEEDALENAEEGEQATEEPDEQPVVWDKLVGYYQQLVSAYETFISFLKL